MPIRIFSFDLASSTEFQNLKCRTKTLRPNCAHCWQMLNVCYDRWLTDDVITLQNRLKMVLTSNVGKQATEGFDALYRSRINSKWPADRAIELLPHTITLWADFINCCMRKCHSMLLWIIHGHITLPYVMNTPAIFYCSTTLLRLSAPRHYWVCADSWY